MFDIDDIKAKNPIEQVIAERIELKKSGHKYKACCPFHKERTPSFNVNSQTQKFNCYGCGEYGDVLDFIVKYEGVDFKTACEALGGEKDLPKSKKDRKKRATAVIKSIYDDITPIMPVPAEADLIFAGKRTPKIWNPNRDSYTVYKPSMVFEYRNPEGMLVGYVLRIDFEDGVKITPSVMWCKKTVEPAFEGWCHYSFPEPRSLYGIERLERNPDAPVLVVEGEKACDAAHILLPSYNVVTWSGGTQAVSKTDWTPLMGRKVLIWPDADQPGVDASLEIAKICREIGVEQVRLIAWDKTKEKGWDAADALKEKWTKEQTIAWAKERVSVWPPPEPDEEDHHVVELPPIDAYDLDMSATIAESEFVDEKPFRALGYSDNVFYYLPYSTQQVLSLTPGQHNHPSLMLLAPLNYWEQYYSSKSGVSWDSAVQASMGEACKAGFFDGHTKLRGRGAWLDAGRSVLHLGSTVYIDSVPYTPKDAPSKHIYPGDIDLNIDPKTPATTKEANKLPQLCDRLTWDNPISGALLTGWCVIAPVCGILKWRPHIWLTGAAGSGKSTVLEMIVKNVLGHMVVSLDGKTTEAGIRQRLKQDALPIVFDEAEAEDAHSAMRMQGILDLARVASSGGRIQKGTADGKGQNFSIRSCFCFSSINTSVKHFADETRITKLVLKRDDSPDRDEKYKDFVHEVVNTITPTYANKMLARALANLRTLQTNCATFVEAAARVFKSRRIADQIGNMLGGTYLCYSDKEITLTEATAWIEKHDWQEFTYITEATDELRLLNRLATFRVKVNSIDGGVVETSLGELAIIASENHTMDSISPRVAARHLKLNGMIADSESIFIANRCEPLKKILQGTPWESEWSRPLKDIPGAESTPTIYFSPGISGRATMLPIELFKV